MTAIDEPGTIAPLLPLTMTQHSGELCIAGVRLSELAGTFGTPLYIYDEATLTFAAREVLAAFDSVGARVSFAAKACSLIGVLATFRREGLNLDAVSAGEIAAGIRAGFTPAQIHLHGNCKSEDDLRAALALGVHSIVVDSIDELRAIQRLSAAPASIWVRLALPIESRTHPHLQTAGGSKFGIEPGTDLEDVVALTSESSTLALSGLHTHLGSQLSDPGLFRMAAEHLIAHAAELRARGARVGSISVGGGWAVPYVPTDPRLHPEHVAHALAPVIREHPELTLAVEPGRALVARAGVALYRVGAAKHVGGRPIVAVDGGMGDNPRPALYGAKYAVLPVQTRAHGAVAITDIVGRYCESGDVLARAVELPEIAPGDLLCIPVAGAYHLSMASAYNLVPPPAAVMVSEGSVRLLQRRATVDDLLARDEWSVPSEKR